MSVLNEEKWTTIHGENNGFTTVKTMKKPFETNGKILSLAESIEGSIECARIVVDNRFEEALALASSYGDRSIYHSHAEAMLLYFKVFMTLDVNVIERAKKAGERTLKLCDRIRQQTLRDNFFVQLFIDQNYSNFTDEEIHAEMIRVELSMFDAFAEFTVHQSIFVLMKLSYRLRQTYMTYKSLLKIIDNNERKWSNKLVADSFRCGINIGLGSFNLMISSLPSRVMNLLSMVGFSGSKIDGYRMLNDAADAQCPRSIPAQWILALHECYLEQIFNIHTIKPKLTPRYVEQGLQINPLSIWYCLYKGLMHLIDHKVEEAVEIFEKCLKIENIDLDLIFYMWETMLGYSLLCNWPKAIETCELLRKRSKWLGATLAYAEASLRIMNLESLLLNCSNQEKMEEFRQSDEYLETIEKIADLFVQVPEKVKRFAGRRIPSEKFSCEKVKRYEQRGRLMVCPMFELLLFWNRFMFIEGQDRYIGPILDHVDRCLEKFLDLDEEDRLLLMLIKGNCFRLLKHYDEAEKCYTQLTDNKKFLKQVEGRHLTAMAALELGLVNMYHHNDYKRSEYWFNEAKSDLKENAAEMLIHVRVHKATDLMKKLLKNDDSDDQDDDYHEANEI